MPGQTAQSEKPSRTSAPQDLQLDSFGTPALSFGRPVSLSYESALGTLLRLSKTYIWLYRPSRTLLCLLLFSNVTAASVWKLTWSPSGICNRWIQSNATGPITTSYQGVAPNGRWLPPCRH